MSRIILNLDYVPLPQKFQNQYYSKILIGKKIVCDSLKICNEMCVYTYVHVCMYTHTC